MATHFYPYSDDEVSEQAPCGTRLGSGSEITFNWDYVDCRACLKRKSRIVAAHNAEERAIVAQMGDMAAFMRHNEQEPRP